MNSDNQILLYEKSFSGKGSFIITKFIEDFQNNFSEDIFKYANSSMNDLGIEHLFWYGEQQIKTAVTTSLSRLCNGYVMQEPGVARKVLKEKSSNVEHKNGRVDYWCRTGQTVKLSILAEVKQAWIRYYSPNRWTMYKYARDSHKSAVKQIKDIDKSDFIVDNLYGVALTILPIFTRYKSLKAKVIKINSEILTEICLKALAATKVHACGGFIIPDNFQEISDWSYDNIKIYESYPGLLFLWSIYKFTKK